MTDILARLRDPRTFAANLHEDAAREIEQCRACLTRLLAFVDGGAEDTQPAPDAEERTRVIAEARKLMGRG